MTLSDELKTVLKPDHGLFELSAIWIPGGIQTNKGKKVRITAGDFINVIDGQIQKDAVIFNSEVTEMFGTLDNKELYFVVRNIETKEYEIVEVSKC